MDMIPIIIPIIGATGIIITPDGIVPAVGMVPTIPEAAGSYRRKKENGIVGERHGMVIQ